MFRSFPIRSLFISSFCLFSLLPKIVGRQSSQDSCNQSDGTNFPGVNELAERFPNDITGVYNVSMFLLTFDRKVVSDLLPGTDSLLPFDGVRAALPRQPAGTHPILVKIGIDVDVNSGNSSTGRFDFHNTHVSIPFVDRSGDGLTGFVYDLLLLSSNPSAIALTLEFAQEVATFARFEPCGEGFSSDPDLEDFFTASSFGTGIYKNRPIYELQFTSFPERLSNFSTIQLGQMMAIANQGQYQLGYCTFDRQFWNLTRSNPHLIVASYLNLYSPFVPQSLQGHYRNVFGVRVEQAGFLEFVSQPCS